MCGVVAEADCKMKRQQATGVKMMGGTYETHTPRPT
jgi:hypothetical protein